MEECLRVGDCDRPACIELTAQVEQQRCDFWPVVEVGLDPAEHAAVLPERARLSRTAIGVTFGDQLDRAERTVVLSGQTAIVPQGRLTAIRRLP